MDRKTVYKSPKALIGPGGKSMDRKTFFRGVEIPHPTHTQTHTHTCPRLNEEEEEDRSQKLRKEPQPNTLLIKCLYNTIFQYPWLTCPEGSYEHLQVLV